MTLVATRGISFSLFCAEMLMKAQVQAQPQALVASKENFKYSVIMAKGLTDTASKEAIFGAP